MNKMLHAYSLNGGLGEVAVSQKNLVACAVRNTVQVNFLATFLVFHEHDSLQVFRDAHLGLSRSPYLVDRLDGPVSSLNFVPYEDVLGVGFHQGFSSMLVPGQSFLSFLSYPHKEMSSSQELDLRMLTLSETIRMRRRHRGRREK